MADKQQPSGATSLGQRIHGLRRGRTRQGPDHLRLQGATSSSALQVSAVARPGSATPAQPALRGSESAPNLGVAGDEGGVSSWSAVPVTGGDDAVSESKRLFAALSPLRAAQAALPRLLPSRSSPAKAGRQRGALGDAKTRAETLDQSQNALLHDISSSLRGAPSPPRQKASPDARPGRAGPASHDPTTHPALGSTPLQAALASIEHMLTGGSSATRRSTVAGDQRVSRGATEALHARTAATLAVADTLAKAYVQQEGKSCNVGPVSGQSFTARVTSAAGAPHSPLPHVDRFFAGIISGVHEEAWSEWKQAPALADMLSAIRTTGPRAERALRGWTAARLRSALCKVALQQLREQLSVGQRQHAMVVDCILQAYECVEGDTDRAMADFTHSLSQLQGALSAARKETASAHAASQRVEAAMAETRAQIKALETSRQARLAPLPARSEAVTATPSHTRQEAGVLEGMKLQCEALQSEVTSLKQALEAAERDKADAEAELEGAMPREKVDDMAAQLRAALSENAALKQQAAQQGELLTQYIEQHEQKADQEVHVAGEARALEKGLQPVHAGLGGGTLATVAVPRHAPRAGPHAEDVQVSTSAESVGQEDCEPVHELARLRGTERSMRERLELPDADTVDAAVHTHMQAVLREAKATPAIPCLFFRSLLPGLFGRPRPPLRMSAAWVRWVSRAMLIAKRAEDAAAAKSGRPFTRFPEFAWAWFDTGAARSDVLAAGLLLPPSVRAEPAPTSHAAPSVTALASAAWESGVAAAVLAAPSSEVGVAPHARSAAARQSPLLASALQATGTSGRYSDAVHLPATLSHPATVAKSAAEVAMSGATPPRSARHGQGTQSGESGGGGARAGASETGAASATDAVAAEDDTPVLAFHDVWALIDTLRTQDGLPVTDDDLRWAWFYGLRELAARKAFEPKHSSTSSGATPGVQGSVEAQLMLNWLDERHGGDDMAFALHALDVTVACLPRGALHWGPDPHSTSPAHTPLPIWLAATAEGGYSGVGSTVDEEHAVLSNARAAAGTGGAARGFADGPSERQRQALFVQRPSMQRVARFMARSRILRQRDFKGKKHGTAAAAGPPSAEQSAVQESDSAHLLASATATAADLVPCNIWLWQQPAVDATRRLFVRLPAAERRRIVGRVVSGCVPATGRRLEWLRQHMGAADLAARTRYGPAAGIGVLGDTPDTVAPHAAAAAAAERDGTRAQKSFAAQPLPCIDLFSLLAIWSREYREEQAHRAALMRVLYDTAVMHTVAAARSQLAQKEGGTQGGKTTLGDTEALTGVPATVAPRTPSSAPGTSHAKGHLETPASLRDSRLWRVRSDLQPVHQIQEAGEDGQQGVIQLTVDVAQVAIMLRAIAPWLPSADVAAVYRDALVLGGGAVTYPALMAAAESQQVFRRSLLLSPYTHHGLLSLAAELPPPPVVLGGAEQAPVSTPSPSRGIAMSPPSSSAGTSRAILAAAAAARESAHRAGVRQVVLATASASLAHALNSRYRMLSEDLGPWVQTLPLTQQLQVAAAQAAVRSELRAALDPLASTVVGTAAPNSWFSLLEELGGSSILTVHSLGAQATALRELAGAAAAAKGLTTTPAPGADSGGQVPRAGGVVGDDDVIRLRDGLRVLPAYRAYLLTLLAARSAGREGGGEVGLEALCQRLASSEVTRLWSESGDGDQTGHVPATILRATSGWVQGVERECETLEGLLRREASSEAASFLRQKQARATLSATAVVASMGGEHLVPPRGSPTSRPEPGSSTATSDALIDVYERLLATEGSAVTGPRLRRGQSLAAIVRVAARAPAGTPAWLLLHLPQWLASSVVFFTDTLCSGDAGLTNMRGDGVELVEMGGGGLRSPTSKGRHRTTSSLRLSPRASPWAGTARVAAFREAAVAGQALLPWLAGQPSGKSLSVDSIRGDPSALAAILGLVLGSTPRAGSAAPLDSQMALQLLQVPLERQWGGGPASATGCTWSTRALHHAPTTAERIQAIMRRVSAVRIQRFVRLHLLLPHGTAPALRPVWRGRERVFGGLRMLPPPASAAYVSTTGGAGANESEGRLLAQMVAIPASAGDTLPPAAGVRPAADAAAHVVTQAALGRAWQVVSEGAIAGPQTRQSGQGGPLGRSTSRALPSELYPAMYVNVRCCFEAAPLQARAPLAFLIALTNALDMGQQVADKVTTLAMNPAAAAAAAAHLLLPATREGGAVPTAVLRNARPSAWAHTAPTSTLELPLLSLTDTAAVAAGILEVWARSPPQQPLQGGATPPPSCLTGHMADSQTSPVAVPWYFEGDAGGGAGTTGTLHCALGRLRSFQSAPSATQAQAVTGKVASSLPTFVHWWFQQGVGGELAGCLEHQFFRSLRRHAPHHRRLTMFCIFCGIPVVPVPGSSEAFSCRGGTVEDMQAMRWAHGAPDSTIGKPGLSGWEAEAGRGHLADLALTGVWSGVLGKSLPAQGLSGGAAGPTSSSSAGGPARTYARRRESPGARWDAWRRAWGTAAYASALSVGAFVRTPTDFHPALRGGHQVGDALPHSLLRAALRGHSDLLHLDDRRLDAQARAGAVGSKKDKNGAEGDSGAGAVSGLTLDALPPLAREAADTALATWAVQASPWWREGGGASHTVPHRPRAVPSLDTATAATAAGGTGRDSSVGGAGAQGTKSDTQSCGGGIGSDGAPLPALTPADKEWELQRELACDDALAFYTQLLLLLHTHAQALVAGMSGHGLTFARAVSPRSTSGPPAATPTTFRHASASVTGLEGDSDSDSGASFDERTPAARASPRAKGASAASSPASSVRRRHARSRSTTEQEPISLRTGLDGTSGSRSQSVGIDRLPPGAATPLPHPPKGASSVGAYRVHLKGSGLETYHPLFPAPGMWQGNCMPPGDAQAVPGNAVASAAQEATAPPGMDSASYVPAAVEVALGAYSASGADAKVPLAAVLAVTEPLCQVLAGATHGKGGTISQRLQERLQALTYTAHHGRDESGDDGTPSVHASVKDPDVRAAAEAFQAAACSVGGGKAGATPLWVGLDDVAWAIMRAWAADRLETQYAMGAAWVEGHTLSPLAGEVSRAVSALAAAAAAQAALVRKYDDEAAMRPALRRGAAPSTSPRVGAEEGAVSLLRGTLGPDPAMPTSILIADPPQVPDPLLLLPLLRDAAEHLHQPVSPLILATAPLLPPLVSWSAGSPALGPSPSPLPALPQPLQEDLLACARSAAAALVQQGKAGHLANEWRCLVDARVALFGTPFDAPLDIAQATQASVQGVGAPSLWNQLLLTSTSAAIAHVSALVQVLEERQASLSNKFLELSRNGCKPAEMRQLQQVATSQVRRLAGLRTSLSLAMLQSLWHGSGTTLNLGALCSQARLHGGAFFGLAELGRSSRLVNSAAAQSSSSLARRGGKDAFLTTAPRLHQGQGQKPGSATLPAACSAFPGVLHPSAAGCTAMHPRLTALLHESDGASSGAAAGTVNLPCLLAASRAAGLVGVSWDQVPAATWLTAETFSSHSLPLPERRTVELHAPPLVLLHESVPQLQGRPRSGLFAPLLPAPDAGGRGQASAGTTPLPSPKSSSHSGGSGATPTPDLRVRTTVSPRSPRATAQASNTRTMLSVVEDAVRVLRKVATPSRAGGSALLVSAARTPGVVSRVRAASRSVPRSHNPDGSPPAYTHAEFLARRVGSQDLLRALLPRLTSVCDVIVDQADATPGWGPGAKRTAAHLHATLRRMRRAQGRLVGEELAFIRAMTVSLAHTNSATEASRARRTSRAADVLDALQRQVRELRGVPDLPAQDDVSLAHVGQQQSLVVALQDSTRQVQEQVTSLASALPVAGAAAAVASRLVRAALPPAPGSSTPK